MKVPRRSRTFGSRELDAFLDEIVDALNAIEKASSDETATPDSLAHVGSSQRARSVGGTAPVEYALGVNTGAHTLLPWMVMGVDGSRRPSLATSSGSGYGVRPIGVVTRESGVGQPIYVASSGVVPIFLEPGVNPMQGDPCYMSPASSGRVTPVKPTTGKRYLIGTFWGSRKSDDRADVALLLDLEGARIL